MKHFNNNREINIQQYVPDVLADVDEYKVIMSIQNEAIVRLWDEVEGIFDNQYITTANEKGMVMFERMHGIKPLDTDTLEDRRQRLLIYYNREPPYTRRVMVTFLDEILGSENYDLEINTSKFEVRIYIHSITMKKYAELYDFLEWFTPYNMIHIHSFVQKAKLTTYCGLYRRLSKHYTVHTYQPIDVGDIRFDYGVGTAMHTGKIHTIKTAQKVDIGNIMFGVRVGFANIRSRHITIKAVE